ncbi:MAG TPA: hypothetical protein DCR12_04880 [Lachnospiraceae bacterium]|nr:hypothetical protein [Lachnospiraceae bacterium]
MNDTRVVSMQFDNAQFEKGIQKSLDSLDKLDFKLNTTKITDNFKDSLKDIGNNISKFVSSIKADKIAKDVNNAVDKVEANFNLKTMLMMSAVQSLTNQILNKLIPAFKRMTFGNITAGMTKYEQKTNSVKTIMSATGKTVEEVNKQLDKLNQYTDETSYNFTDMVDNIGKFTSVGVELKDAASAMEGIASWAASAGQNAGAASRVMYNLSQAMAAGSVKLIDWKSVENANMGTKAFKEQVIQTALELGTLKKAADGTFRTIAKGTEVTAASFNSTLSEGWFSSDVLMKTLTTYNEFFSKIQEASEAEGRTITDLLGVLEASEDGKYSNEAIQLANKYGITLGTVGEEAFRAAQQAKSFTDAIAATSDAVSTGWMKSFELIIGNTEEAIDLWTEVTEILWEVFAGTSEARNAVLQFWHDNGGRDALINTLRNAWESLWQTISAVKLAFLKVFPPKAKEDILNFITLTENLSEKLRPNQDTLMKIAEISLQIFSAMKPVVKLVANLVRALRPLGRVLNTIKTYLLDIMLYLSTLLNKYVSQLESNGVFDKVADKVLHAIDIIANGLIKGLAWVRSTLIDFISSPAFRMIINIVLLIKNAFVLLFNTLTSANTITFVGRVISTVVKSIVIVLKPLLYILSSIAGSILNIAGGIFNVLLPVLKVVFSIVSSILPMLSAIGSVVLSLVGLIFTAIYQLTRFVFILGKWVAANEKVKKAVNSIVTFFNKISDAIFSVSNDLITFIDSFKETGSINISLKKVAATSTGIIGSIIKKIEAFKQSLKDNNVNSFGDAVIFAFKAIFAWLGKILERFNATIQPIFEKVMYFFTNIIANIVGKLAEGIDFLAGKIEKVFGITTSGTDEVADAANRGTNSIVDTIKSASGRIVNIIKNLDWELIGMVASTMAAIRAVIMADKIANAVLGLIRNLSKLAGYVGGIRGVFIELKDLISSFKAESNGTFLLKFAAAISILIADIGLLMKLRQYDPEGLESTLKALNKMIITLAIVLVSLRVVGLAMDHLRLWDTFHVHVIAFVGSISLLLLSLGYLSKRYGNGIDGAVQLLIDVGMLVGLLLFVTSSFTMAAAHFAKKTEEIKTASGSIVAMAFSLTLLMLSVRFLSVKMGEFNSSMTSEEVYTLLLNNLLKLMSYAVTVSVTCWGIAKVMSAAAGLGWQAAIGIVAFSLTFGILVIDVLLLRLALSNFGGELLISGDTVTALITAIGVFMASVAALAAAMAGGTVPLVKLGLALLAFSGSLFIIIGAAALLVYTGHMVAQMTSTAFQAIRLVIGMLVTMISAIVSMVAIIVVLNKVLSMIGTGGLLSEKNLTGGWKLLGYVSSIFLLVASFAILAQTTKDISIGKLLSLGVTLSIMIFALASIVQALGSSEKMMSFKFGNMLKIITIITALMTLGSNMAKMKDIDMINLIAAVSSMAFLMFALAELIKASSLPEEKSKGLKKNINTMVGMILKIFGGIGLIIVGLTAIIDKFGIDETKMLTMVDSVNKIAIVMAAVAGVFLLISSIVIELLSLDKKSSRTDAAGTLQSTMKTLSFMMILIGTGIGALLLAVAGAVKLLSSVNDPEALLNEIVEYTYIISGMLLAAAGLIAAISVIASKYIKKETQQKQNIGLFLIRFAGMIGVLLLGFAALVQASKGINVSNLILAGIWAIAIIIVASGMAFWMMETIDDIADNWDDDHNAAVKSLTKMMLGIVAIVLSLTVLFAAVAALSKVADFLKTLTLFIVVFGAAAILFVLLIKSVEKFTKIVAEGKEKAFETASKGLEGVIKALVLLMVSLVAIFMLCFSVSKVVLANGSPAELWSAIGLFAVIVAVAAALVAGLMVGIRLLSKEADSSKVEMVKMASSFLVAMVGAISVLITVLTLLYVSCLYITQSYSAAEIKNASDLFSSIMGVTTFMLICIAVSIAALLWSIRSFSKQTGIALVATVLGGMVAVIVVVGILIRTLMESIMQLSDVSISFGTRKLYNYLATVTYILIGVLGLISALIAWMTKNSVTAVVGVGVYLAGITAAIVAIGSSMSKIVEAICSIPSGKTLKELDAVSEFLKQLTWTIGILSVIGGVIGGFASSPNFKLVILGVIALLAALIFTIKIVADTIRDGYNNTSLIVQSFSDMKGALDNLKTPIEKISEALQIMVDKFSKIPHAVDEANSALDNFDADKQETLNKFYGEQYGKFNSIKLNDVDQNDINSSKKPPLKPGPKKSQVRLSGASGNGIFNNAPSFIQGASVLSGSIIKLTSAVDDNTKENKVNNANILRQTEAIEHNRTLPDKKLPDRELPQITATDPVSKVQAAYENHQDQKIQKIVDKAFDAIGGNETFQSILESVKGISDFFGADGAFKSIKDVFFDENGKFKSLSQITEAIISAIGGTEKAGDIQNTILGVINNVTGGAFKTPRDEAADKWNANKNNPYKVQKRSDGRYEFVDEQYRKDLSLNSRLNAAVNSKENSVDFASDVQTAIDNGLTNALTTFTESDDWKTVKDALLGATTTEDDDDKNKNSQKSETKYLVGMQKIAKKLASQTGMSYNKAAKNVTEFAQALALADLQASNSYEKYEKNEDAVKAMAEQYKESFNELYTTVVDNIKSSYSSNPFDKFVTKAPMSKGSMLRNLRKRAEKIKEYVQWMNELASQGKVSPATYNWLLQQDPETAYGYLKNLRKMNTEELKEINGYFSDITTLTADQSDSLMASFTQSGKYTAEGFANGLYSVDVVEPVKQIAKDALKALNDELDIHSPSRKSYESGAYFDEGLKNGVNDGIPDIQTAVLGLATKLMEALDNGMSYEDLYSKGKSSAEGFKQGIADVLVNDTETGGIEPIFTNNTNYTYQMNLNSDFVNNISASMETMISNQNTIINKMESIQTSIDKLGTMTFNAYMDPSKAASELGPHINIWMGRQALRTRRGN